MQAVVETLLNGLLKQAISGTLAARYQHLNGLKYVSVVMMLFGNYSC